MFFIAEMFVICSKAPRFRHATKCLDAVACQIVASGVEDGDDEGGESEESEEGKDNEIVEVKSSPQKARTPSKKDKEETRRR